MGKKSEGETTTLQIRLYPTPEQSGWLMTHCQEYIHTMNVLVAALDANILPAKTSTKDFLAFLPSAVKNQALRDAQSVFKRSFELGCIPVLKKPHCHWNNQNWAITDDTLVLPLYINGKTQQVQIPCHGLVSTGKPGLLRIKKKRGKWFADITFLSALPEPVPSEKVMGD